MMTRTLQSLAVALTAALALPACVVHTNDRDDETPDMRFVVTFDGLGCVDARIDQVRITFESGGSFSELVPCDSGAAEVVFRDVPVGTVRVLFEGLDQGFVAYSGRFDLSHTINGSHTYAIDLLETTEVLTHFTFAGLALQDGMTCLEAGIETLNITVGDVVFNNVACTNSGQDAASLSAIDPGNRTIVVEAFDAAGTKLYASQFDVVVNQGFNEFTLNLLPLAKAGIEFSWEFVDAANCAQAGVALIEYELLDAAGNVVFTTVGGAKAPCAAGSVTFAHDDPDGALDAGLYVLNFIEGVSADGTSVLYQSTTVPLYAPAGRTEGFLITLN